MGFLDKMSEMGKNIADNAKKEKYERFLQKYPQVIQSEGELSGIVIATSSICEPYDVIDTILVTASYEEETNEFDWYVNTAFRILKANLRLKCYEMGGTAVIQCKIESIQNKGEKGKSSYLEAIGTVVRRK